MELFAGEAGLTQPVGRVSVHRPGKIHTGECVSVGGILLRNHFFKQLTTKDQAEGSSLGAHHGVVLQDLLQSEEEGSFCKGQTTSFRFNSRRTFEGEAYLSSCSAQLALLLFKKRIFMNLAVWLGQSPFGVKRCQTLCR